MAGVPVEKSSGWLSTPNLSTSQPHGRRNLVGPQHSFPVSLPFVEPGRPAELALGWMVKLPPCPPDMLGSPNMFCKKIWAFQLGDHFSPGRVSCVLLPGIG